MKTSADSTGVSRINTDIHHDTLPTTAQVGGKGWGLLRLAAAGIRVPPAFVLNTELCRRFFDHNHTLTRDMRDTVKQEVHWLEDTTGRSFGSRRNPLVLSVRSGAPVSMPGMMESLLNIGICDESVHGVIRATGNPRLAWDSYRRLILGYTDIVHPDQANSLHELQAAFLGQEGLRATRELDTVTFRQLCGELLQTFHTVTGSAFPQDPWQQLFRTITAVFDSWFSQRAITYRTMNGIDETTGTACLVQSMVFGNAGSDSGSGVGFTRNPADGGNELYVDFLGNAQGEDIVSGRHDVDDVQALQRKLPTVCAELDTVRARLENEFRDMQDFEFTVEHGSLYLLQTRNGKRTPLAALRIAVDLVESGIITIADALAQLQVIDLDSLTITTLAENSTTSTQTTGIPASTGVTAGVIALDERSAREMNAAGSPVVLVRHETSTEDIAAMNEAVAAVTVTGGRTSHAAVVARQLGIACVVGCHGIHIDSDKHHIELAGEVCPQGAWLTVDADNGKVYAGKLEIEQRRPDDLLERIRNWQSTESPRATALPDT